MTLEELLPDLLRLDRRDKLRAIELLAHEVAAEDSIQLVPGRQYEFWSPYDSAGVAQQLMDLLEKDRQSNHD
jgi:hypothetical protein